MEEGDRARDFCGNKVTKQTNLNQFKAGRALQQVGSHRHANLSHQLSGLRRGVLGTPRKSTAEQH